MEFLWGHHPGLDGHKRVPGHAIVQMMERVKENSRGCLELGQGGGRVCSRHRGEHSYCSRGTKKGWNYFDIKKQNKTPDHNVA